MIIDAHQHVWDLDRSPYAWLGPHVPQWNRTFAFDELQPQLLATGVEATVLVQSDDHHADTDLMLEVANAHPEIVAVVVYVPLTHPTAAADRLADLRRDDRVVGVRNLIHNIPDPDYLLRADVNEGLGVLEAAGVTFDLVSVLPRHLEHVPALSERHPDLPIVIDHLSKPPIGSEELEPWWSLIAVAAENPKVHAKVSGLYPVQDARPFVDRALELFGPERLMFGGDWPISVNSGGYQHVYDGLRAATAGLSPAETDQVWGQTAARFYRIPKGRLAAAGLRQRSMKSTVSDSPT